MKRGRKVQYKKKKVCKFYFENKEKESEREKPNKAEHDTSPISRKKHMYDYLTWISYYILIWAGPIHPWKMWKMISYVFQ